MRTRVLVVDDEPDLLELIHYNLTEAGYDVACVLTGEEALVHARSSPPDLIVLDVLLPGLDGLEVYKALRRNATTAGIPSGAHGPERGRGCRCQARARRR